MKLQARFLVLFLLLFGVVALLLLLQRGFDTDRSNILLKNELSQLENYFGKISTMEQQPLKSLSVDYSFWDDMVDFVKTRNPTFAHDNIDSSLSTYGAKMAWVYRADGSLVYYKHVENDQTLQNLDLPKDFFSKLYADHFEHFYLSEPSGLLEVRAATIHPGDDPDHKTAPQGYWLVARVWDAGYISSLGEVAQVKAELGPASHDQSSHLGAHTVTFSRPLNDWRGSVQAVLTLTADVPIVSDLGSLYTRQLFLLVAFALATVIMLVGAIWYLVLSPLRVITVSLKQRDPDALERLSRENTEFGVLAQTIQQFFAQDQKIRENTFIKSKLVELNQAKSEFLAIAAHELKGSVGNVHVFAENLADLIKARTSRTALLNEVERISHQARKATILINDIYQASKGGKALVLNRAEFDFDEFIREEVADAQFYTPQQIVLTGFTAARITSDRDRLGQVMSNLLRNASKYSPHAGRIEVALRREANSVVAEVRDYGLGIAETDQPHVFERFFRSVQVTHKYPGLGLGLSICKEIMEALGGKIWFTSQFGHGSTFLVSLPVSDQPAEPL